jgi:hypothetical protein
VSRHLRATQITRKKTLHHPARDEEKRAAFCEDLKYKEQKEGLLPVYIDESGFSEEIPQTPRVCSERKAMLGFL